jgi:UDP-N-acetylglucosamine:LPS N-acetylglucosamine transferase
VLVPDVEVDRVPRLVDELLADPERLAAMREAMLGLARPDAAETIADELVALAEGRA